MPYKIHHKWWDKARKEKNGELDELANNQFITSKEIPKESIDQILYMLRDENGKRIYAKESTYSNRPDGPIYHKPPVFQICCNS